MNNYCHIIKLAAAVIFCQHLNYNNMFQLPGVHPTAADFLS